MTTTYKLEWKDPKDALEIALLFQSEGERLKDRGFLEDAKSLFEQIEKAEQAEADRWGDEVAPLSPLRDGGGRAR